ncbi:hypothetical protein GT037_002601 [Alternaria burnsii]|uniref:Heterokaryon incompatibility domain-containing protein n=1 Tax=Alternaria burnsii TaxID=1187904 RepID=A0A8H7B728_9PLEO|nr:uncharacterized protein GT037_002601 [Alternaria burnsii]KAF7678853.1 hypothetical protein GT037_002601 [Alternaria burnsii]
MVDSNPHSPPPDTGICWECSSIPTSSFFESWASLRDMRSGGSELLFRGTWDEVPKGCALCNSLMAYMGVPSGSEDDAGDSRRLRKKHISSYWTSLEFQGTSFPCFAIFTSAKDAYFAQSSILRSVPTSLGDIMLAKRWIFKCSQSHEEYCGQDSPSGYPLKVIDCASRKLCEIAPGTPYVCLSYVWGNASVAHEISSALSGCLPKTIEDSIWVTLQLGYSYIWIDRYCIDQRNDAEKHHLIKNMGAVYGGATLTIIAAAGESPHSGLPGINGTPRRLQYSHAVGTSGQRIISLEVPRTEIQNSFWNTRGWTFQELVLSRRRLVFTGSQMYFQCNSMHGLENLPSRHPASPSPDPSLEAGICHDDLIAFPNLDMRSTVQTLYLQIEEYYDRRLSFREDSIKAVTGIINAFELGKGNDRIRATQVFGLPIFYNQTSPTFCLPSEKKCNLTVFTPTSTFAYSLTWSAMLNKVTRYSGVTDTLFPSWSWASCKANRARMSSRGLTWQDPLVRFSCEGSLQVWIHDESGRSLELNHYIKTLGQEDDRKLVPKISIRSWVVPCETKLLGNDGALAWGFKTRDTIMLDSPWHSQVYGLAAIYLGSDPSLSDTDDESWIDAVLLVVRKVDDSTWRRIGVLRCSRKRVSHRESTLAWFNRINRKGGWEMRTLCLV